MIKVERALLSLAMLLAVTPASAHHSGADGEPVRIEGVVRSVRMVNPHAQIILEVESDSGETQVWVVSGAPPAELRNLGWTSTTVPVGARIKVLGRPAGLGERIVDLDIIEFQDGRVLVATLPLGLQPGLIDR